jgi:hypothetical protein
VDWPGCTARCRLNEQHHLRVALVDPFDLNVAEDLRFALGKDIHVVVSPSEQIEELIKQY